MYNIILYYTIIKSAPATARPRGRPAPSCRGVWGAARPPSGVSERKQPPQGNPGFFKRDMYKNLVFAKTKYA